VEEAVTPEGVEHDDRMIGSRAVALVEEAVTPEGVEHCAMRQPP
jgi:hypothetical protein